MPALPLFAQLRRYTLAVIAAAETAANFSAERTSSTVTPRVKRCSAGLSASRIMMQTVSTSATRS
jgi:hypothetical protein